MIDTAFIRAPIVTRAGEGVQVVAHHEGKIVGVRAGNIIGISFHPGSHRRYHRARGTALAIR